MWNTCAVRRARHGADDETSGGARPHRLIAAEMPERDPEAEYGSRLYGKRRCRSLLGEYVTYCDDDDVLRPQHCAR